MNLLITLRRFSTVRASLVLMLSAGMAGCIGQGRQQQLEAEKLGRLLQGVIGVAELQSERPLLGQNSRIDISDRGLSGTPTVNLTGKYIDINVDVRNCRIVSYLNKELFEAQKVAAPKENWTPSAKMFDEFQVGTDLFGLFSMAEYRSQFPEFRPETFTSRSPLGATFVATRRFGKYQYWDEKIWVRLSFDGKKLMQFMAVYVPLPPESDKAEISSDQAKVFLMRALRKSTLVGYYSRGGARLMEDSPAVDPAPVYVHPNAGLEYGVVPDLAIYVAARLAYVGRALYESDEGAIQFIVWLDARDGKCLGGLHGFAAKVRTKKE